MKKFILGYPNSDANFDDPDDLVEYAAASNADFDSEEWLEVEAETLDEARNKYHEVRKTWEQQNKK